jgi:hypothetical protein
MVRQGLGVLMGFLIIHGLALTGVGFDVKSVD